MALLSALVSVGQRTSAAHVHHGLRAHEADFDLEAVRDRARRLGVPFRAARVDATKRDGRSPEARGRHLRYAALEELRAAEGADWIATAHTLDDQAETVLLRAARGTGPAGLAGIAPCLVDRRLIRPLLGVRRQALRRYLADRRLTHREDASNRNLGVPRNRVRARVLPELESVHPGAIEKLAALAEAAAETEAYLEAEVDAVAGHAVLPGSGGLWLDPEPLSKLPRPLLRRVLVRAFRACGLAEEINRMHLDRSLALLGRGRRATRLGLPHARVLVRVGGRFWLGPEPGPRADGAGERREGRGS